MANPWPPFDTKDLRPGLLSPGALGSGRQTGEAQNNVDFLCNRFTALFQQLANEEAAVKAAEEHNNLLDGQLKALISASQEDGSHQQQAILGSRFEAEAAELRAEAQAAEQKARQDDGEANALAAAKATYERQCARLQERCLAEAERERRASEALLKGASGLKEMQYRRSELQKQLDVAEAQHSKFTLDLRQAHEGEQHVSIKTSELQGKLRDEQERTLAAESEANRCKDEVDVVERRLIASKKELEDLQQRLAKEREETQSYETQLREQVGRKTRFEEELAGLCSQLEQKRREGSELQVHHQERIQEAKFLRDRLDVEKQKRLSEVQGAEAAQAQLKRMEAELAGAERAKADVETELSHLRQRAFEMDQRCTTQRHWHEEQRQKQTSSEMALERLRDELRLLTADRGRLEKEADQTTQERTRLEVELQVATPAVQEVWRRCQKLEDRLSGRVRELSDESDRVHRLQMEADAAKARLEEVGRHTEQLEKKLKEYKSIEPTRQPERAQATVPEPAVSFQDASGSCKPEALGPCRPALRNEPRAMSPSQAECLNPVYSSPDASFYRRRAEAGLPEPVGDSSPRRQTFRPQYVDVSGAGGPRETTRPVGSGSGADSHAISQNTNPAAPVLPAAGGGANAEAVRFLCEFVAREEARLGLVTPS